MEFHDPMIRFSALIWVALLLLLSAASAGAATFTVDRFDDANGPCSPGDCSIREALLAAEGTPEDDTIILLEGTHTLSIPEAFPGDPASGGLEVQLFNVELIAPDGATIDAQGVGRVIRFLRSTSRLENLTIRGGSALGSAGGGIYGELSTLDLVNVWVVDNEAFIGGGLALEVGLVTLEYCTISDNTSLTSGGGAYVLGISSFTNPGRLEFRNTTVSGNSAQSVGGAVRAGGTGEMYFEFSTIVGNSNRAGDPTLWGFITTRSAEAIYTLVEGACSAGSDNHRCMFLSSKADEVPVLNLGLGPLAMNGGSTPTHGLLPGSPAIDAVPLGANCPPVDQRGTARPEDNDGDGDAECDAGAYEGVVIPVAAEVPDLGWLARIVFLAFLAAAGLVTIRK